jgi:hypothetical protein
MACVPSPLRSPFFIDPPKRVTPRYGRLRTAPGTLPLSFVPSYDNLRIHLAHCRISLPPRLQSATTYTQKKGQNRANDSCERLRYSRGIAKVLKLTIVTSRNSPKLAPRPRGIISQKHKKQIRPSQVTTSCAACQQRKKARRQTSTARNHSFLALAFALRLLGRRRNGTRFAANSFRRLLCNCLL